MATIKNTNTYNTIHITSGTDALHKILNEVKEHLNTVIASKDEVNAMYTSIEAKITEAITNAQASTIVNIKEMVENEVAKAKDWACKESGEVEDGLYSSKYYSEQIGNYAQACENLKEECREYKETCETFSADIGAISELLDRVNGEVR